MFVTWSGCRFPLRLCLTGNSNLTNSKKAVDFIETEMNFQIKQKIFTHDKSENLCKVCKLQTFCWTRYKSPSLFLAQTVRSEIYYRDIEIYLQLACNQSNQTNRFDNSEVP